MFASVSRCAAPISQPCQLKVKVTGLSLEFRVRFISPIPLEGFSLNFGHMFASVRRCAELITQPYRHKVKVTVQGHRFEPWISCPLCISYTSGRIFFKFWSNVHLSETICNINNSTMPIADSRSRSQFKVMGLSLEFRVRSVSPLPLGGFSLNFGRMFTCGIMCRTHNSAMGSQGQGQSSRSRVWALNFMSTRYLLYPWNDFLLILVKCLPQWSDVQNP